MKLNTPQSTEGLSAEQQKTIGVNPSTNLNDALNYANNSKVSKLKTNNATPPPQEKLELSRSHDSMYTPNGSINDGYSPQGKSKESFFYPNVDSSRVVHTTSPESWNIRRKVVVKMHLRRILSVDIYNKRFSMVFNVDFSWPDIEQTAFQSIQSGKKLPWTPKILFPNSIELVDVSKTRMITVQPSPIQNGWPTVIQRRKFKGTFTLPNQSMFNYPFEVFDASIVIESDHSPDEVEFVAPQLSNADESSLKGNKKQNLVKLDWEFFVHPNYELIMNTSSGSPEVTLEFHSGDSDLDTSPRLYIDVKFQRKSVSQFVLFVLSYFVLNQISWLLLILDIDANILGILTLVFIIMLIHVALRVRFAKEIPIHEYVLLPDSYRYFSSLHVILLMIYFCSMYNQNPTAKTNIQSIFLGILISIHVISHFVFVCEIMYARRTEKSKIQLTSYYQSIIKYGPRILSNDNQPKSTLNTKNDDLEEQSSSSSSSNGSDDENSESSGMLNYSASNTPSRINSPTKKDQRPKRFWDTRRRKEGGNTSTNTRKSRARRS